MASCLARVGYPAPPFSCTAVVDGRLKEVSLDAYTSARHWLILVFYPRAWSAICPTEIRAFSARADEFVYVRACGVCFASTDAAPTLRAWDATPLATGGLGGVHVPLLADPSHALARAYGVLKGGDVVGDEGAAQRALFIIDPRGIVRSLTVNDSDVGRGVDETLRVLDALIFRDRFGQGCPVDWKKGDKGIDVASGMRVEGRIDLRGNRPPENQIPPPLPPQPSVSRASWSGWSTPRLVRMGSYTSSQKSITSETPTVVEAVSPPPTRVASASGAAETEANKPVEIPILLSATQTNLAASPAAVVDTVPAGRAQ